MSTPLSAQIQFKEALVNTPLHSASIYGIAEDNHGFIWTLSSEGVSRYDGYNVEFFQPNPNQAGAILEGALNQLIADQLGQIWIASSAGLSRYDDKTNTFINYSASNSALISGYVTAVAHGANGSLLIADTDGLYRFQLSNNTIERFSARNYPAAEINFIHEDNDKIWLSTREQGVYALDKQTSIIYDLNDTNPWDFQFFQSQIYAIQRFAGSTWVGSIDGLFEITSAGVARDVFLTADRPDLKNMEVRDIKIVDNTLWLATSDGILTMGADKVIKQRLINASVQNDPSNYLMSMLTDSKGVTWVGSFDGAFRTLPFSPDAPRLIGSVTIEGKDVDINNVWSIKQAQNGDLWLTGIQDRVIRINADESDATIYNQLTNSPIWDIALGNDESLWIASSDGIYNYTQADDGALELYQQYYPNSLVDKLMVTNEAIWFWHDDFDLIRIDQVSKEAEAIAAPSMINFSQPVGQDSLGRIWFNSNMGSLIYEPSSGLFEAPFQMDVSHPLHAKELNYFYAYAGHYYAVTKTNGIFKLQKSDLSVVQHVSSSEAEILSAIGDDDSIWYSGSKTLHKVQLPQLIPQTTLTSQRFGNNEHFDGSVTLTNGGIVFFGGEQGLTRISPDFLSNPSSTSVVSAIPELLNLRVFNNKVEASDEPEAILSEPIYLSKSISLEHRENRFTLDFGVINPINAQNVQYRYRLVGYEDDWIYNKQERTAPYSRVTFGNYQFEVQSKTFDSDWSDSRILAIEIAPPIWLHQHALIFYAFFLLLVTMYLVRHYQARKASQLAIRESEERLKLTLWSSGDELWDWDIYGGQVHRSNVWGTLDFPQDNIRTHSSYDANIHPNDIERVKQALQQHLDAETEFFEIAYRAKTFKGDWIWLLDRGKVVKRDQQNKPLRMTGTLKNIQHLKQAEEQLYLFKRSIENISEGVFITNTEFRFVSVNNAYCNYTGETREKALASYLFFHQYPDAFTNEIKKALRQKGNWSGEVESIRSNGERFEIELNIDAIHGDDNKITHYVGVFSDITSRKNTEKELLKLANVDPLTDLPNRSFFQASHQNLVRKDVAHTLICLDMDNFKKINDSLGHQTGDILIKQIARRVQRITGSTATCYRLGGDEFSILVEDKEDVHTITHFAQNVLDTLSRPFVINKQEFVLSASLGIAFYPDDGRSPQELLKNADTAMYFAKNGGGNSYQFFSGEMNQNAVRQLQIENLIRHGIRDNLFSVFYQPKVDIASGKLVSMEALVRFEHPQKGIVSPNQFIPLAEQTGQIIEIGEQVLRKACEDTKRWVNEGLFTGRVAVNISAKQFELPDLDDRIDRVLRQVGLSPLHLECELTEGTLMENPEQGLKLMQRLRERGIHLALDDFGTGYSSLAYLKRFPLNTLKIDKAFIDDIAESSVDRHMAAAIINIAHNLGLKVVAEGVEQEKQLSILRRYDCEMLQGYLYSKPLSAEKFEKLLRENQKLHQLMGETKV